MRREPLRVMLTGGSRGIGAAIAQALRQDGAQLALIVRDATLASRNARVSGAHYVEGDLLEADPDELVRLAAEVLGGLDVLINCAGIVEYQGVPAISPDAIDRQLRVNFVAPLRLAQAAAARMRVEGRGHIISIASTLALSPAPLTAVYGATKAALIAATRSLALELAADGICVNAVAPGVIDTDMVRAVRVRPGEAPLSPRQAATRVGEELEALRRLHLLGRLGKPSDVAGAVRYLLASSWVTGTVLRVDGGLTLGSSGDGGGAAVASRDP
ncbi:MAG: SDR family NAD(P)-dependent oxidoreductase [Myxococcales bacterium]|nr:SDR family NAD(P)-dependent oxidoreductase [Myxococcales bacterium]MDD9965166.1 SDR family NAD(P)-dependent oxidoreductase [Myxococcales bacterium]